MEPPLRESAPPAPGPLPDSGGAEVCRCQLAHFPRADDQDAHAPEIAENLARQLDSSRTHRNGVLPDARFAAHPLGRVKGGLKKPVQVGPDRTGLDCDVVERLHLSQGLGLPQNHRIQGACDAKDVPHRLLLRVAIELLPQLFAVDAALLDRKSTRLNSSHRTISYAVFSLKKK